MALRWLAILGVAAAVLWAASDPGAPWGGIVFLVLAAAVVLWRGR